MSPETQTISPDEIYEEKISGRIDMILNKVESTGGDITPEQRLSLAQTITTGLLERDWANEEGEYSLKTTETHETGEIQKISRLVQNVPKVVDNVVEMLASEVDEEQIQELNSTERLRMELLAFTAKFEDEIEQYIEEEMEEK